MIGNNEYGVREYGYDYDILEPSSSVPSSPLSGALVLMIFGQPLWIVEQTVTPSQTAITITGSAVITDTNSLPYRNCVTITGSAVIRRGNNYLT
jgi:hypothetical protein